MRHEVAWLVPQFLVPVDDVGRDDHQRALWDVDAIGNIRLVGAAREGGDGRVKPHRLFDHGARHGQPVAIQRGGDDVIARRIGLTFDLFQNMRRASQQIQRPCQHICRSFVPSTDEGDDVGPDLHLAEALAVLRVPRCDQRCQQISRCGFSVGDHGIAGGHDLPNCAFEEVDRRLRHDASHAGYPRGSIEDVERIDPSLRLEIT